MFSIIYKTKKGNMFFLNNIENLSKAQNKMKYYFKNKKLEYIFILKNINNNKIDLENINSYIENMNLNNVIFWWKNNNCSLNIDFDKIKLNYFELIQKIEN